MNHCLVQFSSFHQGIPKTILSDVIVRRVSERLCPECFTISPGASLNIAIRCSCGSNDHCCDECDAAASSKTGEQLHRTPSDQKVKANLSQISVSICPRLFADLHDPNHRDEHPQEP